jgi:selenocysteine-specific elongation factor
MVAGASGIDAYLMVVAADDGVMPQTREHAAVLRALGVDRGVVAVTKADLADPARAAAQAAELLPGAVVVPVAAPEGRGIDVLRSALDVLAAGLASRAERSDEPARLHVDRSFTIPGAGTVVTGTLWAGSIGRGDEVELLRGEERPRGARVRSVEVHDEPAERASAGQRVALNLVGVARDEVGRGDVVVAAGSGIAPAFRLDAELALEDGLSFPEHGARVQVHHGTRDVPARLAWLGGRFWQLRLEQPLVAVAGDRVVVRQLEPADTIGGGRVLDAAPRRHGAGRELLVRLERLSRGEAVAPDVPRPEPTAPPAPPAPPAPLTEAQLELERRLRGAGLEAPPDSVLGADAADLAALRAGGRAVRLDRDLHVHPEPLAEATAAVVALLEARGEATLAEVRDALGTSRRYAQALLEHLDAERVTLRVGDARRLRGRGRSG